MTQAKVKYIVDTQIFLWWLSDDGRLSSKARTIISSEENTLFFSAASVWEISIKSSLGKLPKVKNLCQLVMEEGFQHLPITAEQAEGVSELSNYHKDPFDRLLLAQSRMLKFSFLTSDKILARYGKFVVVV